MRRIATLVLQRRSSAATPPAGTVEVWVNGSGEVRATDEAGTDRLVGPYPLASDDIELFEWMGL